MFPKWGGSRHPSVFASHSLQFCLKTAPKLELFHWENIAPTAYLLDTNEHFFFIY